jgi:hypothetical protein
MGTIRAKPEPRTDPNEGLATRLAEAEELLARAVADELAAKSGRRSAAAEVADLQSRIERARVEEERRRILPPEMVHRLADAEAVEQAARDQVAAVRSQVKASAERRHGAMDAHGAAANPWYSRPAGLSPVAQAMADQDVETSGAIRTAEDTWKAARGARRRVEQEIATLLQRETAAAAQAAMLERRARRGLAAPAAQAGLDELRAQVARQPGPRPKQ